jgi:hypothetical protein
VPYAPLPNVFIFVTNSFNKYWEYGKDLYSIPIFSLKYISISSTFGFSNNL